MAQTYFLVIALNALKWYIGSGAFNRITALVTTLTADNDLKGSVKMSLVQDFVSSELKLIVNDYVVKAVVELTLAKLASSNT